jgi:hypothetical protein
MVRSRTDRFKWAATWGTPLLALAFLGCGGGAAREARQLGSHGVLEGTRPLDQNLVKPNEIEPASDASGVRTVLRFWLTLQRADYESAIGYFDPALVTTLGRVSLTSSLRELAPLWDSTKPTIVVARTMGRTARVFFNVRDLHGTVGSVEIMFRRLSADWKIHFFSLLPTTPAA